MIFAEPRFATAIIDERDLAGMADCQRRSSTASSPAAGAPAGYQAALPRRLVPVGSDQARSLRARRSGCRHSMPARARAQLFGQRHRDDLHARRGRVPRRAGSRAARTSDRAPRSLLVVGALRRRRRGSVPRDCSPSSASTRCVFPPRRCHGELPPVGPRHVDPAGAAVSRRYGAGRSRRRGASSSPRLFPLGAEGTTTWLQRRAQIVGYRRDCISRRSRHRARAGASSARSQPRPARRQAHFLLPGFAARDPAGAVPSARTREWSWSRSARPISTARHLRA